MQITRSICDFKACSAEMPGTQAFQVVTGHYQDAADAKTHDSHTEFHLCPMHQSLVIQAFLNDLDEVHGKRFVGRALSTQADTKA